MAVAAYEDFPVR